MYKKLIAMIMTCIMLVSISPAVAAENASAKPTVEEILNEYHKAAFEAQYAAEADTSATYSPRSGLGDKTLEQETVDTLNAAGYEAYNVTPANYSALEDQLNTDFADMGLDPDGSYIIAIHGEDSASSNTANGVSPRAIVPPPIDDHIGRTTFDYTYNGTTYTMRYVTVTPTENSNLIQIHDRSVQLLNQNPDNVSLPFINLTLTALSFVPAVSTQATILSLLFSSIPNVDLTVPRSIAYTPTSLWTITYTQVYHSEDQAWKSSTAIEYVIPQCFIDYYYYDPTIQLVVRSSVTSQLPTIYSEHYNDQEHMKQIAAIAFERGACAVDPVEEVVYKYNGNVAATHYRKWEYIDFTPPS